MLFQLSHPTRTQHASSAGGRAVAEGAISLRPWNLLVPPQDASPQVDTNRRHVLSVGSALQPQRSVFRVEQLWFPPEQVQQHPSLLLVRLLQVQPMGRELGLRVCHLLGLPHSDGDDETPRVRCGLSAAARVTGL